MICWCLVIAMDAFLYGIWNINNLGLFLKMTFHVLRDVFVFRASTTRYGAVQSLRFSPVTNDYLLAVLHTDCVTLWAADKVE
jgi:hypothetical protein